MERNKYSAICREDNPCIGCTHLSCITCACYTGCESEWDELRKLHVPTAKKEKYLRKTVPKIPTATTEIKTVHISSSFFGYHNKTELYVADSNGMSGAGIYEGDAIIFDLELEPRDGDIVIANVEGRKYCRRYYRDGNKGRFHREDGITQDMVTKDFVVLGVMVGLMRKIERVS